MEAKELPRGPNGRALCRNCGTEVPMGRRTLCSEGCVDDWATRYSPTLMRQRVFRRDNRVLRSAASIQQSSAWPSTRNGDG